MRRGASARHSCQYAVDPSLKLGMCCVPSHTNSSPLIPARISSGIDDSDAAGVCKRDVGSGERRHRCGCWHRIVRQRHQRKTKCMKCQDGYTGSHMPTKSESQSGFLFIIKTPLTLTMIRTKCFMPHMLTLYRYGRSRPIDKYISGLPLFLIQTMIPR